ncbi:MAG: hypothetical protein WC326_04465 [Candidatus Delongbacteria bacterium]
MTPDYSKYTLEDLIDSLRHVNGKAYPEALQALLHEASARLIQLGLVEDRTGAFTSSFSRKPSSELSSSSVGWELRELVLKHQTTSVTPDQFAQTAKADPGKPRESVSHEAPTILQATAPQARVCHLQERVSRAHPWTWFLRKLWPSLVLTAVLGTVVITLGLWSQENSGLYILLGLGAGILGSIVSVWSRRRESAGAYLQVNGSQIEWQWNGKKVVREVGQLERLELRAANRSWISPRSSTPETVILCIGGERLLLVDGEPGYTEMRDLLLLWIGSSLENPEAFIVRLPGLENL